MTLSSPSTSPDTSGARMLKLPILVLPWATQTGKGLLFYADCEEDKSSPVGIFNLVSLGNNIIGDLVR